MPQFQIKHNNNSGNLIFIQGMKYGNVLSYQIQINVVEKIIDN